MAASREWELDQEIRRGIAKLVNGTETPEDKAARELACEERGRLMIPAALSRFNARRRECLSRLEY